LHNPPANGNQWPIPEEMSQTLLTNKKQGKLDYDHAYNIINPTQTRINHEKYTFCVIKSSVVDPYSFFTDPDPELDVGDHYGSGYGSGSNPIRIQGFNVQKLKKNYS
jgi:hypothetical protein